MTKRRTLGALALVAVAAAVVAVLAGRGGDDDEPPPPTRAIALATAPSDRSYALVERLDNGRWRPAVARVSDDGDMQDIEPVDVPIDRPAALATQGDDALLIAGDRVVEGRRRPAVARVAPDGKIDRSFGAEGVATFRAGDDDALVRGLAAHRSTGIVITADASEREEPALALVRATSDGHEPRTHLTPNATAGTVATDTNGAAMAAGTDTRDGSALFVRAGDNLEPRVTRARTTLGNATWRALARTRAGAIVAVGSGRDADSRSVLAIQPFGAIDGRAATPRAIPVGDGDAYAAALEIGQDGRALVAVNGVAGDRPAAFVLTLGVENRPEGPIRRRAPGRVTGLASSGGVLTTRWDGGRQTVQFTR